MEKNRCEINEPPEILTFLGRGGTPLHSVGSPGDLRWRAYTAWEKDYNHLIHTGRYLRYEEPGIEQRFPGAYPERNPSTPTPEAPALAPGT